VGVTPLAAPLAHYDAARAALNRYTLGLAQELSPDRIRVDIVTPGPVLTRAATPSVNRFSRRCGALAPRWAPRSGTR
jgi:NAD(P)-dependent dehydrogenase (short-subunit alcohol dehydrogenase family)